MWSEPPVGGPGRRSPKRDRGRRRPGPPPSPPLPLRAPTAGPIRMGLLPHVPPQPAEHSPEARPAVAAMFGVLPNQHALQRLGDRRVVYLVVRSKLTFSH